MISLNVNLKRIQILKLSKTKTWKSMNASLTNRKKQFWALIKIKKEQKIRLLRHKTLNVSVLDYYTVKIISERLRLSPWSFGFKGTLVRGGK